MKKHLHRPGTKLISHSTSILAADFSRDGSRLVSVAANDPTVRVWDVEAARTVSKLDIAKGVNKARLFPTGDRLAATFDDGVARVYELESGNELARAHQMLRPRALCVSPAGGVYWAGFGGDNTVVWSWLPGESPKPLLRDIHCFEPECSLSLARDGQELWCFFEWDLVGFDTRTGTEIARFHGDRDVALGEGLMLSPERCAVVVQSMLNRDDDPIRPRIYKWNLDSDMHVWGTEILGHPYGNKPLLTMARSQRWIASVGKGGVMFHSLRSGRALGMLPFEAPEATLSCLSVSPDDGLLAVGASNGDLVVHDLGDSLIESSMATPHIATRSRQGKPLTLRLQKRPGLWLRVHEDGSLERAEGDARADSIITTLVVRADHEKNVSVYLPRLRWDLRGRLWQHDLTKPSPYCKSHPVQVFLGADLVVEGYLGVESDPGVGQTILGVDSDRDGLGERVAGTLSPRTILAGINDLLALLPD
ncbi:WD40 repeat domain-containing protein [Polyangium mundeleinium]|uniref:WD40 repeat domain-containing protein n=1 Tax=Polyangium mundeleinium TaxID=2995306 RepID=A0ABT5F1R0_9BACT|nr:hypothetical protein [Polyangium mundeleinium]MDC0748018.1 hypothetical protein [Polyangium mundeleinium]